MLATTSQYLLHIMAQPINLIGLTEKYQKSASSIAMRRQIYDLVPGIIIIKLLKIYLLYIPTFLFYVYLSI